VFKVALDNSVSNKNAMMPLHRPLSCQRFVA
jgi:hypothetical protein